MRMLLSGLTVTVLLLLLLLVACACCCAANPSVLPGGPQFYGRLVQLPNSTIIIGGTNNGQQGIISVSTDRGGSFQTRATIPAGPGGLGMCCIDLWATSVALGAFPAGTLYFSASVTTNGGPPLQMELRLWASVDQGQSLAWTVASACSCAAERAAVADCPCAWLQSSLLLASVRSLAVVQV